MESLFSEKRVSAFLFLAYASGIAFLVCAYFFGGRVWEFLYRAQDPRDFFMHVNGCVDRTNVYLVLKGTWGCFPALAYVMYYFFSRIILKGEGAVVCGSAEEIVSAWLSEEHGLSIYMYYQLFVLLLFVYALSLHSKRGTGRNLLIAGAAYASPVFFLAVRNGNSILIVISLILIGLKLKDSESSVKRDIAIVIFSVCVGLKIYPAFLVVLYLRERRFAEAFRFALLSALLFFIPFAFFGGMKGFFYWFTNVLFTSNVTVSEPRVEFISGIADLLYQLITGSTHMSASPVIAVVFLVVCFLMSLFSKSDRQALYFACCMLSLYPANAWRYSASYMLIPFFVYLLSEDYVLSKTEAAGFAICTLIMIQPVMPGLILDFAVWEEYRSFQPLEIIIYGLFYLLLIIETVSFFRDLFKRRQSSV